MAAEVLLLFSYEDDFQFQLCSPKGAGASQTGRSLQTLRCGYDGSRANSADEVDVPSDRFGTGALLG